LRKSTSFFRKFQFLPEQLKRNLRNAQNDLKIARRISLSSVRFTYSYTALIKAGIALLSCEQLKVRSVPGHHSMIIEHLADVMEDRTIADMGEAMRSLRNQDFYGGGILVTDKDSREYLRFVERVLNEVELRIKRYLRSRGEV
jgi:hypothetical protein